MKKSLIALAAPAVIVLAGCSASPSPAEYDKMTMEIVKKSFVERGIATLDRLEQDEARRACWESEVSGKPLDDKTAKAIEEAAYKSVKWPSDGKFLGDWKQGEAIAQSGRGLTWTDGAKTVNGGNCYACHQLEKAEVSFGTLGPSLTNYGKDRKYAPDEIKTAFTKIYNSQAVVACSNMPRFGANKVLDEQQIKDLVALLFDPESPVNK